MAKAAMTINEALTSGLMKAFNKSNVQYRKVNGEEHRFTFCADLKQITVHNSKDVLQETIPESDFPK